MLESDVLRACLDYLSVRKIFHWRSNQAAIPLKDGGFRAFNGMRGVSDILGILPQEVKIDGNTKARFGNLLAVEVKRPGGKPSPEQVEFLATVNRLGGIGLCVDSVDQLDAELQKFML